MYAYMHSLKLDILLCLLHEVGRAARLENLDEGRPLLHKGAGEGIEYAWGFMKGRYRHIPLRQKKRKEDFESCVKKVVSYEEVSVERVRRFSLRARRYITAYYVLHGQHVGGE